VNTVTGNSSAAGDRLRLLRRGRRRGTYQSINILGLTPGTEYVATVYTVAFDAPTPAIRWATFSVGDDHLTVNQDQWARQRLRISYRYFADATGSATFNIAPVNPEREHSRLRFSNRETVNRDLAPSISVDPLTPPSRRIAGRLHRGGHWFPYSNIPMAIERRKHCGATSATYSIAQASAQNADFMTWSSRILSGPHQQGPLG